MPKTQSEQVEQTQNTIGVVVIVAAIGMTFGLLGSEISGIDDWDAVRTPAFVGKSLIHISTVIASAIGGSLIKRRHK